MWLVELVKTPTINDFRAGFFPRKFRYKTQANDLVEEVRKKGGEAKVTKIKK
jgi:hypothetical protein